MRRRSDQNQKHIVDDLRRRGISVHILADVGGGCPDLLCGYAGRNVLLEIKNPNKPASDQRLTEGQREWHRNWRGQVATVKTLGAALRTIGAPIFEEQEGT